MVHDEGNAQSWCFNPGTTPTGAGGVIVVLAVAVSERVTVPVEHADGEGWVVGILADKTLGYVV